MIYGASSGIGLACVDEILETRGDDVLIISRTPCPSRYSNSSRVHWCQAGSDTANLDSKVLADQVKSFVNNKGLLINGLLLNAGLLNVQPALAFTPNSLNETFDVNFYNHIFLVQALLPKMLKFGGSIVGISSSALENHSEGRAIYNSSKAALEAYLLTLGREVGRRGVRVNIVRPGLTETALMRNTTSQEGIEKFLGSSALGTISNPSDIAKTACFLLSEQAASVTCSIISAHGGARV